MYDTTDVMAMKYAFVTNRALRAISCIRAGRPVPPRGTESLDLAAQFLLEMRRGTALFVDSQEQLGYSAESIPAATRAFSIIRHLSLASRVSEIDGLLEAFENSLKTLAAADNATVGVTNLDNLERFIRALNKSLTEEVSQATLGNALENSDDVGA